MIQDQGQHVIVSRSYGSFEAYTCTLDNARGLLASHESALPSEVRALSDLSRDTHYVVSAERVSGALKDVMDKDEGVASAALRALLYGNGPRKGEEDPRPVALVTSELKEEVTLWCVKNRINPLNIQGIDAEFLNRNREHLPASLFSGVQSRAKGKALHFVDNWVLDVSEEYTQLKSGAWKADAKEHRIVSRYLQFIVENLVDKSDVNYEVSPLNQTV